jgi:hypothetical protein
MSLSLPPEEDQAVTPYLLLAYLTYLPSPGTAGITVLFCPGRVILAGLPAGPGPAARPGGPEMPVGKRTETEREKALAEWRERVARLPKVETRLTRMVVYRDAVVTYAIYRNRTKAALRVSLIREPLHFRGLPLKDSAGGVWQLPLLENHYLWVPDDTENTAVLGPGEELELRLVDRVEEATLRPVKAGAPPAQPGKPATLNYEFGWATTAFMQKDFGGSSPLVQRVGAGAVKVEWKDEALPRRIRTAVERRLTPGAKGDQPSKSGGGKPEGPNRNRMTLETAWQRLLNEFPEKEQEERVTVPPRSAARFAGFVEGYTGTKLPRWWEEALFSAGGYWRKGVYFDCSKNWPYHSEGRRPNLPDYRARVNLPRDVSCVKKDDFSVLRWKGAIVRVPKKVLDHLSDNLTLSFQGDRCIFATHSDWPDPCLLFCVDRATSKVLWEAEITPLETLRGFSGRWWHCVEIIPREKSILVFGAALDGLYVAGLDSENGKQLFRFSSYGAAGRRPSK